MKALTRSDVVIHNQDANTGKTRGAQWHVEVDGKHFIISAVDLDFGGFTVAGYRSSETMAFEADERGEVTSWMDLAMVPYKDHEACIVALLESLNDGRADD